MKYSICICLELVKGRGYIYLYGIITNMCNLNIQSRVRNECNNVLMGNIFYTYAIAFKAYSILSSNEKKADTKLAAHIYI